MAHCIELWTLRVLMSDRIWLILQQAAVTNRRKDPAYPRRLRAAACIVSHHFVPLQAIRSPNEGLNRYATLQLSSMGEIGARWGS